jgi:hypothetical protein
LKENLGMDDAGDCPDDVEVRVVHPFEARKAYVCPGCQQEIQPGSGHLVAVPVGEPELRRHWHRPCWRNRTNRKPGR